MEPTCNTEFLHMNDDCLLEIFKNIGIEDLANVNYVCQRLSILAQQSFRMNHRNAIILFAQEDKWDVFDTLELVLKTFGKTAIEVTIISETDLYRELGTQLFLLVIEHRHLSF